MFKWILGLLIGSCSILFMPSTLSSSLLAGSIFGSILTLYLYRHHQQPLFRVCLLLLSGCLFGFGWSLMHVSWRLSQQIQIPANNSAHIIKAEVDSLPVIYPNYCQFRVKVTLAESNPLLDKKLLLKDYSKQCDYELGQFWQMTVKLKPIHGPVNQAGFDYEFYMFQQGLDGKGYIRDSQLIASAQSLSVSALRQYLYHELDGYHNAGLLQALIIGEKANIPQQDRETLRQLGLSHLVAISGLHISIIAGLSFWLTFWLLGWLNVIAGKELVEPYRIALLISCVVALGYSALAAFAIPTVRALIMWCSVVLIIVLKRQRAFLSGLKFALLSILIIDPLSVLSASFWMSFIAVTIISFMLTGRIAIKTEWRDRMITLTKLQVAITLILTLPALLIFQEASIAGVLVNIIMIPLFSLVLLPLVMLAVLVKCLFNAYWLLHIVDQAMLHFFETVAQYRELLDIASFDTFIAPWILFGLFMLSLILLLPLAKIRVPIACLSLVLLSFSQFESTEDKPRAIIFDVGHGLSVLLTDGKHHILYDTGYASAGSSAFDSYIYPSLRELGIERLDALILSHKDNDHAGGATDIVSRLAVKRIIAGEWANHIFGSDKLIPCRTGLEVNIGQFHLDFLHPAPDQSKLQNQGDNNGSCVIKVSGSDTELISMLLTGDIERESELLLAENLGSELAADLMLAPHHGSNSSSTYPFIKMVSPEFTIYSTERYSRYNLPHPEVKKRYRDFDIKQLHTGCLGQINYDLTDMSYSYERQRQHIWRKAPCHIEAEVD